METDLKLALLRMSVVCLENACGLMNLGLCFTMHHGMRVFVCICVYKNPPELLREIHRRLDLLLVACDWCGA